MTERREGKSRLIVISDAAEIAEIFARQGELDVPHLLGDPTEGPWFADADELRAWRAARESQRISEGESQ